MSGVVFMAALSIVPWIYLFKGMLHDEEMIEKERERCRRCPFECDKYREEDE